MIRSEAFVLLCFGLGLVWYPLVWYGMPLYGFREVSGVPWLGMSAIEFYKIAYSKLMTMTGSTHCSQILGTKSSVDKFDKMNITDVISNPKASEQLKAAAEKYKNEASTFGQLKSNLQKENPATLTCKKTSSPSSSSRSRSRSSSRSSSSGSWMPSASTLVDSFTLGGFT